jgi:hypothetical protein
MVDRDDTDNNNKHIRYLYFDIVGCVRDPTWYTTAYNLGTGTYYIGGDDLVIEFTDWTNGDCEVNYSNSEIT